jgi:hypothetical protein
VSLVASAFLAWQSRFTFSIIYEMDQLAGSCKFLSLLKKNIYWFTNRMKENKAGENE